MLHISSAVVASGPAERVQPLQVRAAPVIACPPALLLMFTLMLADKYRTQL